MFCRKVAVINTRSSSPLVRKTKTFIGLNILIRFKCVYSYWDNRSPSNYTSNFTGRFGWLLNNLHIIATPSTKQDLHFKLIVQTVNLPLCFVGIIRKFTTNLLHKKAAKRGVTTRSDQFETLHMLKLKISRPNAKRFMKWFNL